MKCMKWNIFKISQLISCSSDISSPSRWTGHQSLSSPLNLGCHAEDLFISRPFSTPNASDTESPALPFHVQSCSGHIDPFYSVFLLRKRYASVNVFNLNSWCPDTLSAHMRSKTPQPPSTHQLSHHTTHVDRGSIVTLFRFLRLFPLRSVNTCNILNSAPAHRVGGKGATDK